MAKVNKKVNKAVAPEKKAKKSKAVVEVKMVRCPDCPVKAGLKDDYTLCPTCEGIGNVESKEE